MKNIAIDDDDEDNWYLFSENEIIEENLSYKNFIKSLSALSQPSFLKKLITQINKPETNENDQFFQVQLLSKIGIFLQQFGSTESVRNMLTLLAFYYRFVPKMWKILLSAKYIQSFQVENIKGKKKINENLKIYLIFML